MVVQHQIYYPISMGFNYYDNWYTNYYWDPLKVVCDMYDVPLLRGFDDWYRCEDSKYFLEEFFSYFDL